MRAFSLVCYYVPGCRIGCDHANGGMLLRSYDDWGAAAEEAAASKDQWTRVMVVNAITDEVSLSFHDGVMIERVVTM